MQVFLGNDTPANAVAFARALQAETQSYSKQGLKAFILLKPGDKAEAELVKLNAPNVGVAILDGEGAEGLKLYKISSDPKVKNTVLLYKDRVVVSNFVNLDATGAGSKTLSEAIAKMLK